MLDGGDDPSLHAGATFGPSPMAARMKTAELFRLDGKTVFLSGAAGHLGRQMALALGGAGAKLLLNGRNVQRLAAFANELGSLGISAECAAFDMTDFVAVRRFFN